MTTAITNDLVDDRPPPSYRRRRALSTIGAFSLMLAVSLNFAFGFLVVPGSAHFNVSAAQFLVWFSISTVSMGLSSVPLGKLMAAHGTKIVVVCSGLLATASMVCMAFAPNIATFYLLSITVGIGLCGCTSLAATTIVVGWHLHKRRGTVLGGVMAAMGLGGFAWGFVFPPLLEAVGWRAGLLTIAALIAMLTVLPGIFLISNPPIPGTNAPRTVAAEQRKVMRAGIRNVVVLVTIAAAIFSFEGAFAAIMPAVFSANGLSPAMAGALVSYYSVFSLVVKPLLGYINDRWGIHTMLGLLSLAYVVGLPGLSLLGDSGTIGYYLLLPVAALSLAAPTIAAPLVITRCVGAQRYSAVYGTMIVGNCVGLALGAPAWGLAYDVFGSYRVALALAGVAGLMAMALLLIAVRTSRRPDTEAAAAYPQGTPPASSA
ncbi:MFS transporter [Nocardia sp. FBN12]|uniref:MFS transporter n=1 Tax=Nocardia sp. FBN12 TaxID=3419766 RepID=UPI003D0779CE